MTCHVCGCFHRPIEDARRWWGNVEWKHSTHLSLRRFLAELGMTDRPTVFNEFQKQIIRPGVPRGSSKRQVNAESLGRQRPSVVWAWHGMACFGECSGSLFLATYMHTTTTTTITITALEHPPPLPPAVPLRSHLIIPKTLHLVQDSSIDSAGGAEHLLIFVTPGSSGP